MEEYEWKDKKRREGDEGEDKVEGEGEEKWTTTIGMQTSNKRGNEELRREGGGAHETKMREMERGEEEGQEDG